MKKSLSTREIILIALLVIIAIVGAYMIFWYTPMAEKTNAAKVQAEELQNQVADSEIKLIRLNQMTSELQKLKNSGKETHAIGKYNNLNNEIDELNDILNKTNNFKLAFGDADVSDSVVKRTVTLSFTSNNYAEAKAVLTDLANSENRCMITDLKVNNSAAAATASLSVATGGVNATGPNVSTGSSNSTSSEQVSVTASLVYFEYQER